MSKHSALPYTVGNAKRTDSRLQWCTIADATGTPIAKATPIHPNGEREAKDFDTEAANAAYIVQACNAHAALVSALRVAQAALLALSAPDEPGDMPEPLLEQIASALEQAGETR